MPLVYPKDVALALGLSNIGFIRRFIARIVMWFLRLHKINSIYDRCVANSDEAHFTSSLLYQFRANYHISPSELKRIPTKGPVVLVSNHALGGLDGIMLIHLLQEVRPDFKLMANFILERVTRLKKWFIGVNPFDDNLTSKSSIGGFRQVLRHLENDGLFAVFPAGEVASKLKKQVPIDPTWNAATMRLIQRAKVPVVPVYFHARNSPLFYRLAKIHPLLRTARLPAELLTQRHRSIDIRIGKPIAVKDQDNHQSIEDYSSFVRRKLYMLSNIFERKSILKRVPRALNRKNNSVMPIAPAVPPSLLEPEIIALKNSGKSLLVSKDYELFLTSSELIPNILTEIGRQREITFRAVGEGTNKPLDWIITTTTTYICFYGIIKPVPWWVPTALGWANS